MPIMATEVERLDTQALQEKKLSAIDRICNAWWEHGFSHEFSRAQAIANLTHLEPASATPN